MPDAKPDRETVKLAKELVIRQEGEYDPADVEDRYEERLRKVIEAKLEGAELPPEPEEEAPANVVDLMAALRASLRQTAPKKPSEKPRRKRA